MRWLDQRDHMTKRKAFVMAGILLATTSSGVLYGHPTGPMGEQELAWQNAQIGRVTSSAGPSEDVLIDGLKCVTGQVLNFDVRSEVAFDIDEDVRLTLEVGVQDDDSGSPIKLLYEKSGEGMVARDIPVPRTSNQRFCTISFIMERARFANNGPGKSDFSLIAMRPRKEVTVRDVSLKLSHATIVPSAYGDVDLQISDEHGVTTPALVGLYDAQGRLPLPTAQAVPFRHFADSSRVVDWGPGLFSKSDIPLHWPASNHSGFFIDGCYQARLPAGKYHLVVAKGPEYRVWSQSIEIGSGAMNSVNVRLNRWDDLSAKGWYSGDDHIHYTRENAMDDKSLLLLSQAADVHVANILQMGNVAGTHFNQYDWKVIADSRNSTYVLVPGQEDPRTTYRGHTIQMHLNEPIRDSARYLLYDEVFRQARAQGALVGYAHVNIMRPLGLSARKGMAMDLLTGLIDFVEVLQNGELGSQDWFDYLNLGCKIAPSAGTDFPYIDQFFGAVRSYVKIENGFSAQAWFDGLKQGRTFVTNGPMLEFTINGQGIGAEMRLEVGGRLSIRTRATINPDVDLLERIDVFEQGDIVKTVSSVGGATELRIDFELPAKHGTWFVVRAQGRGWKDHPGAVAMSAPIYVVPPGGSFWKPEAIPEIVGRMKQNLDLLSLYVLSGDESWKTRPLEAKLWASQEGALKARIETARAAYEELAARAKVSK